MQALIDGDIFPWEIGSCAHYKNDDGEDVIRDFDFVQGLLDKKISDIMEDSFATGEPLIFLTNSKCINDDVNRKRAKIGLPQKELKPNFREAIAVTKPYKGTRAGKEKPYHFDNIVQYLLGAYNCRIADGMEADDLITITHYQYLTLDEESIICTRDKDLRIARGWHYGWKSGLQASYGPKENDELGEIHMVKTNLKGCGLKFFYAQCLMGDTADNIPGLPRIGPKKAYEALERCVEERGLFYAVLNMYMDKYEDDHREKFLEQAQLLWMVRDLHPDGSPVMYIPYDER